VLVFFAGVLVIMLVAAETRMALLLTPIWFIILFATYAFRKKKAVSSELNPVEN
jgi:D-serine/D-alanine/glycine transporter